MCVCVCVRFHVCAWVIACLWIILCVSLYIGPMWLLITLLILRYILFISDLKIVYNKNYYSFITRVEKYFCVSTYLEAKWFKTVLTKFRRKFSLTIIPRKAKFIVGYTNVKPQVQLTISPENPRSDWNLPARCPDNVEALRDTAESVRKSLPEEISNNLVFYVHNRNKSVMFCPCHLISPFWSGIIAFEV